MPQRSRENALHFMKVSNNKVEFGEADLKEVFSLFASPSAYELNQLDDPKNEHYFGRVNLMENMSSPTPGRILPKTPYAPYWRFCIGMATESRRTEKSLAYVGFWSILLGESEHVVF
jgi:hypothetical protein